LKDPKLSLNQLLRQARTQWHGIKLNMPDWGDESHCISLTAKSLEDRYMLHLMVNAYWEGREFEIPRLPELDGHNWKRWIDTSRKSPDDISLWDEADVVREAFYPMKPRSLVILFARIKDY
jgi:glycogen operon protein